MKKVFRYLWRIWFIFLAFLFILPFAPLVLLLSIRAKDFPYAYFFIRLWCLCLFYGMGFWFQKKNYSEQKLDKTQNYIFVSNHTSMIDIMLMCVLHPHHPICFIGKAELAKIPLFGLIYRRICILVDRKDPKSRANVYPQAAAKIRDGQNLVIFPEGGVPEENITLDTFKDGAFIIAAKHNIPIVAYTFLGLKEKFPFRWNAGSPGMITVVCHGIFSSMSKDELKYEVRDTIYKEIKKYEEKKH